MTSRETCVVPTSQCVAASGSPSTVTSAAETSDTAANPRARVIALAGDSRAFSSVESEDRGASAQSSPYTSELDVGGQSRSVTCLQSHHRQQQPQQQPSSSLFHSTGHLSERGPISGSGGSGDQSARCRVRHHHHHHHHQPAPLLSLRPKRSASGEQRACDVARPARRLLSDEERRRRHQRRLQRQTMSLDLRPRAATSCSPAQRRRQPHLLRQTTVEVPEYAYLPGVDMETSSLALLARSAGRSGGGSGGGGAAGRSYAFRSGDSVYHACAMGGALRSTLDETGGRHTRRSNVSLCAAATRRPGSAFGSAVSTSLLNLNAAETSALVAPMLPVLAMAVQQRATIGSKADAKSGSGGGGGGGGGSGGSSSRRMRWAVIATGLILFTAGVVMVGVTLKMAPLIDDMVRRENEVFYGRYRNISSKAANASSLDSQPSNQLDTGAFISTQHHRQHTAPHDTLVDARNNKRAPSRQKYNIDRRLYSSTSQSRI